MKRIKPVAVSKLKDVWGFFASDLNFRLHNCGPINQAGDYPRLSPEKMVNWYQSIHSDRMAWSYVKLQSGHAPFPSKVLPRMKNLPLDFYQRYCELSRAAGIYVMAYTCGGDDEYAFQEHPEWFREYGRCFACLNAPFWDREFEAVREALRIFPCDGLFYDMVLFSGNCDCEFCQAAYRQFYGERMPERHDVNKCRVNRWNWKDEKRDTLRFRFDTFKVWVERATRAGREIVPGIEVVVNQQWFRPDGVPYELLERFDGYFCEFGFSEWIGEIMRAWGGEKPMLGGNVLKPWQTAHLLGRRISPCAYDCFIDYRTGEFVSVEDKRVKPIASVLAAVRQCEPYVKDACAIPHTAVLYSNAANSYFALASGESAYSQIVAACVREATRLNLNCCSVEIAERLSRDTLDKYEVIFAPELGVFDGTLADLLCDWVKRGGILIASGLFGLLDQHGEILPEFSAAKLLGISKTEGPLDVFSVLTGFQSNGKIKELEKWPAVHDVILCSSVSAEPVAYGNVGADENIPLLWRNEFGKGVVFYLAGRIANRIEQDPEESAGAMRICLRELLLPHIRKAPFKTSLEYPAEVWFNEQPGQGRLVLHVVAFDKPLKDQHLSVRDDLMADDVLEVVYPASRRSVIKGGQEKGYKHFLLPSVHEHMILTAKKSKRKPALERRNYEDIT